MRLPPITMPCWGKQRKSLKFSARTRFFSVNILVHGKPMIEMIENQVYLAQGAYAKVIGRSEGLLAVCAGLHYALVTLHLRIQTAAAYAMLGKNRGGTGASFTGIAGGRAR